MKTTVQSLQTHLRLFYVFIVFLSSTAVMTAQDAFITTWDITASDLKIRLPYDPTSGTYLYTVDFGDGTVLTDLTTYYEHTYSAPGIYTVKIWGDYPHFPLNNYGNGDELQLLSVEQWGDIEWTTMAYMFAGCSNMIINALDTPDLTNVTTMESMFWGASSFNQSINHWDVSSIEDMDRMFMGATQFNQPLNNWNVSNVTDMWRMFYQASSFNQPLDQWDVSNVGTVPFENIEEMFYEASAFNQDLTNWNINTTVLSGFISYTAMSVTNYESFLSHLVGVAQNQGIGISLGADGLVYCDDTARSTLIDLGSIITGDTQALSCQTTLIPDANFEQALIDLGHDNVIDGEVLISNINTVTSLDVSNYNISDLTGIENFSALQVLNCQNNALTFLNLNQNTNLTTLVCHNNSLTTLDLSSNINLVSVDCKNNQLSTFNIKNGNNANVTFFDAINNNLFCIQVDDTTYATNNWSNIDATAYFYENCSASITYIPDPNFEQALINLGLDHVVNGEVITSNISSVVTLDVSNKNISDLTGIGSFTSLENLNCQNNSLTTLNLNQNTNLISLHCYNNTLNTLDLSLNTNLTSLFSQNNNLTTLDLSNNINLVSIDCKNNQLTAFDVKNGNNINVTFLDATTNNLACIQVDDATYSTNNWSNIDGTAFFSEDCSSVTTLIPDANFEQALINLGHDDVIDGKVLTSNIENLTDLFIQNSNISDLTGIEDFSALQYLWCDGNSITSLDVSQNTNLETLGCNNNAITSLNLGTNTNLDFLRCNNNMLTALDVSQTTNVTVIEAQNNQLNSLTIGQNSNLEKLWCSSNQLTALDVSDATSLNNFSCWGNQITELDLSQNSNLQFFFCNNNQLTSLNVANGNNHNISGFGFDATNNSLTCIQVDDANYSTNNWSNIDNTAFFSEDCSPPSTLIPDPNFEQALIDLGLDNVIDGEVITSNISSVTALDINNKNISDLTGIEDFTALENLYCHNNSLTSINLSQNTDLELLHCHFNALAALDLSQNTNLITLFSHNNNLEVLDLSNNSNLISINCKDNQLITLDVKNGNNTNVTFFNATNNTNLTCIQVDDANYSTNNWSNIDGTASFSEDCQIYTLIPDPNFEQALIDLGYDSYINGKVLTNNINTITSLDVANKNISNLTGIEDFAALENLVCHSNNLISLNISQNTNLEVLECYNNTLNVLDTSQNLNLTELNCSHNNLTNLDVSQNLSLEYIDCTNNNLEVLNVKNSNNLNFTGFAAYSNPNLVCIEVDNIDYAITNWSSAIDPVSSFSEDCDLFSECESYTIWNGSTWSNGFPDENSQAIINGIYTVTSDLEICELNIVVSGVLIVDEGVRLTINGSNSMTSHEDSALWVGGILEINGDVNNDGGIIFTSTSTSTGQLASVPSGANILGNVEVQRYIPARRAFRFLSTAVNTSTSIQQNWQEGANNTGTSFPANNQNPNPGYGTHITGSTTGANGFDATISGNHSLFTLDNTAQAWETVQNTDTNTLLAGEAYRLYVRGDRSINPSDNNATPTNTTLRSVGSIQTGDFIINDLNQTAGGFNFIGNPYQAVVDMNQVIAASTNINPVYYYVWDPTLNTQGAYVTIELPSGTNASGSAANKYLQPGQAVFVQTLADGAAEITFKENHKAVTQPQTAVFSTEAKIDIRLYEQNVYNTSGFSSDGVRFKFSDNGDNTVTYLDAPKLLNQDENLAALNGEDLFSIENRALPEDDETIPLFVNQYRHNSYVFEIEVNLLYDQSAFLVDSFTGQEIELFPDDISTYAFELSSDPISYNSDRFYLHFRNTLEVPEVNYSKLLLHPNPVLKDYFYLNTPQNAQNIHSISIYNSLGVHVYKPKVELLSNNQLKVSVPQLPSGVYLVTVISDTGTKSHTKFVKH